MIAERVQAGWAGAGMLAQVHWTAANAQQHEPRKINAALD
jgi:hypothetical protein